MKTELAKADLHVHSKFSKRPSEWVLQKLGCAESYTEPLCLYNLALERGMDYVTITDHNTIDGSLEIAHLDNTFVSEEITTYFPEDRCKIHVLAHHITESQHQDITHYRENIFDLVSYLNQAKINHAVAHPLFSINGRLTFNHFEKLLLLFGTFELNGSRDYYQNRFLVKILEDLTREKIEALSEKHQIQPWYPEPWIKNIIAGSDDHSALNVARYYTEVENVSSFNEFLEGILQHRSRVGGRASTPKTMAHTLYSIAYQFYNSKFNLQRYTNDESLLRFADIVLTPFSREDHGMLRRLRSYLGYRRPKYLYRSRAKSMPHMLLKEARNIIYQDPHMKEILHHNNHRNENLDDVWFRFVNRISEQISTRFADSILDGFSGANLFDVFQVIGSAGSLYTMLAPYFVAYGLFCKDRRFCRDYYNFQAGRSPSGRRTPLKVAHFTDTFYEVNGVAKTLQRQVEVSLKLGKQLTMITCSPRDDMPGVINFHPIGTFEMPEYPELKLYYPPLLRMLDYCYHQNFTQIHSATPGPVGLAAIIVARILNLPLHATYHTALPQYADQLTEDPALGEIMWRYMVWYYNQSERVFVPSRATGQELLQKGIPSEKIHFYPRGIDVERFHPRNRNGFYKSHFNIQNNTFKLLYVGRISREKNLHLLGDIFRQIASMRPDVHLILVGDGPYVEEMKEALKGYPVTFTGYLQGDDLSQAYASGDIFIFPSTTDTFGNVVLEAQASGLPVIVTEEGGPRENMIPHKTGYILNARDQDLFIKRILDLMDNKILLEEMRKNARDYMEKRTFESAFLEQWNGYRSASL